jgi:hypothetical protein
MTLRELTLVGLRIVAIWMVVSALTVLPTLAYGIVEIATRGTSRFRGIGGSWIIVGGPLFVAMTRAGIGVLLFVLAPRLTRLVCGDRGPDCEPAKVESIRAGDLYHVAAFLMGIYVLVRAVSPGVRALVAMVEQADRTRYVASLVESIVLLVLGGALVLGARGAAAFFGNLGYDPDNVPAQQFSVRVVLFAIVGIAVLLVAIRALVK